MRTPNTNANAKINTNKDPRTLSTLLLSGTADTNTNEDADAILQHQRRGKS